MRPRVGIALAALVVFGGVCWEPAAASEAKPAVDEEWPAWRSAAQRPGAARLDSAHFTLITDLPQGKAQRLLCAAEHAFDFTAKLVDLPTRTAPARLLVFDSIDTHEAIATECGHDLRSPELCGASGFFSSRCQLVHLGFVPGFADPRLLERALMHETMHQALSLAGIADPRGPGSWIVEGLATLLEGLSEDGTRLAPEETERLSQAVQLVNAGMLVPLARFVETSRDELLAMKPVDVVYPWKGISQARLVSLYQVQAFALINFLHEAMGSRFPSFVSQAGRSGATSALVREHARRDLGAIEREFILWVQGK